MERPTPSASISVVNKYKHERQEINNRYATYTTVFLLAYIAKVCVVNIYTAHRGRRRVLGKIPVFLKLDLYLKRKIHAAKYHLDDSSHGSSGGGVKNWLCLAFVNMFRSTMLSFYFNLNTIVSLVFWTTVFCILSLTNLKSDWGYLATRLGKVATVCLPTIFFLSLKPSPLPRTLYLNLLPLHKWLARIVVLQSVLHAVLYMWYFYISGTMFKALRIRNFCGWIALCGFLVIIVTSLMRQKHYRLFYYNHYVWSWIIVIVLQFHARPVKITGYTIANICILSYQIGYRVHLSIKSQYPTQVKVVEVSPHLALVEFPVSLLAEVPTVPGAHVRVTKYHRNPIRRFFKAVLPYYHPYTLASLPLDRYQRMIIRKSTFKFTNDTQYIICGSYDPHLSFIQPVSDPSHGPLASNDFTISKLHVNAKRILVVIGGSAILFTLPLVRVMNYHGIPIKVVWVIKDFRDIIILKYFDGYIHGDDFEIFVTGDSFIRESASRLNLVPQVGEGSSSHPYSNLKYLSPSTPSYGAVWENEEGEVSDLEGRHSDPDDLNQENQQENVEIDLNNESETSEDDDDSECLRHESFISLHLGITSGIEDEDDEYMSVTDPSEDEIDFNEIDFSGATKSKSPLSTLSPLVSKKSSSKSLPDSLHPLLRLASRKSSMSEPFTPHLFPHSSESARKEIRDFRKTVKKLKLENKIYKGRPVLNYKYFNWCVNQGFTQCTGPVLDDHNNLVCCKLIAKQEGADNEIADLDKVWVISAGPEGLVKNVRVWARENGFNFHEESFSM